MPVVMCNADVRLTTAKVDGNGLHTQGHATSVNIQDRYLIDVKYVKAIDWRHRVYAIKASS